MDGKTRHSEKNMAWEWRGQMAGVIGCGVTGSGRTGPVSAADVLLG